MNIKKAYQKFISLIVASLLVCLFVVPEYDGVAKDSFVAEYIQKDYSQSNGIGSNEVNCIYQSSSGYIWVGTDGGLYRSNGGDFQSINLWDTDSTDVYSINCIMQDSQGRVWIGTDNYGLFYIQKGETHHLQEDYYQGIKCIKGICEYKDGTIYVSTSNGLYFVGEDEEADENGGEDEHLCEHPAARLAGGRLGNIVCMKDELWIQRGDNEIYVINKDEVLEVINFDKICEDNIQSIEAVDENVYIGTTGDNVVVFSDIDDYHTYTTTVDGINGFVRDNASRVWICADNGVGFFDENYAFYKLNDLEIDNYMTDMLIDYEGNLWFTSSKMGVLYLSRSKFTDFNLKTGMGEYIVNCVFINGKDRYIGTDEGLKIYDADNAKVENELTELLSTTGIRHICKDPYGVMWIATARRFGLVRVANDGTIRTIGKMEGLPSMSVEYLLVLNDGRIAVATDEGLVICSSEGEVEKIYDADDGFSDVTINCMFQDENNNILIGTDGNGIYSLDLRNDKITVYSMNDGLNSNVIKVITEGDDGLFIGTDNGLCFYNDTFRSISSIDYSNEIYDIILYEGEVWIIGSKGIMHAGEEELLSNNKASFRYFDRNDGINKNLNSTGKSGIDINGKMYICCDTGLYVLNTENIPYNVVAPKIIVTSVDVDGKIYEFDDLANGLEVDSNVSRISVKFSVFTYTNRENMSVEYSLEGFDENPTVISGNESMEAVYTNLKGGTYEFNISAVNGDGIVSENTVSFTIVKKKSFFEKTSAKVLIAALIIIALIGVVHVIVKLRRILISKNEAIEELAKEHEEAVKSSSAKNDYLANMSNEIKTPINVMMVKAEELLNVMDKDAPYRDDVEAIYSTGHGIIEKVDDIILLAKIEAGKIETMQQQYALSDIMYDLSEYATEKLQDKPLRFYVEIGEEINENMIGDAEKIRDILKRIIENAIRFTKEGSITLSVDCYEFVDKNHQGMINLIFTVSDTGIGIPEDRIDDLFHVYKIADNRKSGYNAGNGIGLTIAKGYADLIGGELQAESVYGGGSTFTLSVNQRIVEHTGRTKVVNKIDEVLSKEDAEKLWLPDVNILIVEDEEQSLEITKKVLSKFEMKIDVASSGINAIDMIMNNEYDVIFMDITLPIMNGVEAMKEIREIDGDSYFTLPIISMDVDAIDNNRDQLLEAGFTDTLIKPIDHRRVAAILMDCLPQSKIKERASTISDYISGSRYSEGLLILKEYLDVEGTIEKIGGSIDVFNKLIATFYNQNNTSLEGLDEKFTKDIRGFKNKVHMIKTGSANIGAHEVSQQATRIEAAINIGNKEYTRNNLNKFMTDCEELLQVLADYINLVDELSGISDDNKKLELEEKAEENAEAAGQSEDEKAGQFGQSEAEKRNEKSAENVGQANDKSAKQVEQSEAEKRNEKFAENVGQANDKSNKQVEQSEAEKGKAEKDNAEVDESAKAGQFGQSEAEVNAEADESAKAGQIGQSEAKKRNEKFAENVGQANDKSNKNAGQGKDDEGNLVPTGSKVVPIDLDMLEDIKYAVLDGDFQMATEYFDIINNMDYVVQDKEFMDVLGEAIEKESVPEVDQLITTYIDLK